MKNGEGSLGKLIRDETLHQNLTELSHRSERALTSLEDNMAALKETWPFRAISSAGPMLTANERSSSPARRATAAHSPPTICSKRAAPS